MSMEGDDYCNYNSSVSVWSLFSYLIPLRICVYLIPRARARERERERDELVPHPWPPPALRKLTISISYTKIKADHDAMR
jgi:hypothetical protein